MKTIVTSTASRTFLRAAGPITTRSSRAPRSRSTASPTTCPSCSGGVQNIFAGASEDYSQVHGVEHISAGGTGYGETVYAVGKLYDYGVDSFSTILSGGQEYVRSGGAVTSAFVSSGGQLYVSSGSIDSSAIDADLRT